MVGIGGGIPDLSKGIDIRLGDIVVSKPEKTWGGVVQYDKGKAENGGKFVVKGQLNQPPALLLQTLAQLRARHGMRPSKVSDYINEAIERNPMMEETGFTLPSESDCFYCSVCHKDIESPAADCEGFHTKRKQRKNNKPVVHYGVIASGNQVVKDAAVRDRLRDEFDALCVEMEAAGLMNEFPVSRDPRHLRLRRFAQERCMAPVCCDDCCCIRQRISSIHLSSAGQPRTAY